MGVVIISLSLSLNGYSTQYIDECKEHWYISLYAAECLCLLKT